MSRRGTANGNAWAKALPIVLALAGPVIAQSTQVTTAPSRARAEPANFVQWRAGLASSAQPDAIYLARVKVEGFGVVINLAPPQSHGSIASEGAIVVGQGVRYVNLPVAFGKPTVADFKRFSEEMQADSGANVLVHCQVNMRASAFVFLYRVIHEDAPVQDAAAKLTGVWVPDGVWKKFIEDTLVAHGKKADIL